MLGRCSETVGTLRNLAWSWVLGLLRKVLLLQCKWVPCLPHYLPLQSRRQCLAASAAMRSERAGWGSLSIGAGMPLLQLPVSSLGPCPRALSTPELHRRSVLHQGAVPISISGSCDLFAPGISMEMQWWWTCLGREL